MTGDGAEVSAENVINAQHLMSDFNFFSVQAISPNNIENPNH